MGGPLKPSAKPTSAALAAMNAPAVEAAERAQQALAEAKGRVALPDRYTRLHWQRGKVPSEAAQAMAAAMAAATAVADRGV